MDVVEEACRQAGARVVPRIKINQTVSRRPHETVDIGETRPARTNLVDLALALNGKDLSFRQQFLSTLEDEVVESVRIDLQCVEAVAVLVRDELIERDLTIRICDLLATVEMS